jgi:hypothetical protein
MDWIKQPHFVAKFFLEPLEIIDFEAIATQQHAMNGIADNTPSESHNAYKINGKTLILKQTQISNMR